MGPFPPKIRFFLRHSRNPFDEYCCIPRERFLHSNCIYFECVEFQGGVQNRSLGRSRNIRITRILPPVMQLHYNI